MLEPWHSQTSAKSSAFKQMLPIMEYGLCSCNKMTMTIGSRYHTSVEQNYSTTEKEFLAIVWAFEKFHPYLHGTSIQVETDHQLLVSLIQKTQPPGRLLRWALALQEYNFTMIYRRGASNTVVDALSQMEYHAAQWTEDANDLPFQPQQIAQMQQQDPVIKELILQIQNSHEK